MKISISKYALLLIALLAISEVADAQRRRGNTRRPTTRRNAPARNAVNNAPAPVVAPPAAPAVDTTPIIPKVLPSLRNDGAIERNLVKDRQPLAYEHLREDDAVYRQRVWKEIDIREKMNLPFSYSAVEDNGDQRFIYLLLKAVDEGKVTAFSSLDDRFTTPLTRAEVMAQMAGKMDTIKVPNWVLDPTGSKGIMKDSVIRNDFNPTLITKYRIKEDWVFDKESSRMHVRIIGIAPIKQIIDENTGEVRAETPMFWLYYPDLRPELAKMEAYNGKNFGARMTWEELFESGFYSSYVVKSTIDNPQDLPLKSYVKDPILRLLEGEGIKEKIFNYEQNLWSY